MLKSNSFRTRDSQMLFTLSTFIDMEHPLVKLASIFDWGSYNKYIPPLLREFHDAPDKPVRMLVGLCFLQQTFNLTDQEMLRQWVENPYWQYFCGSKHLAFTQPATEAELTAFRKCVGEVDLRQRLEASVKKEYTTQVIVKSMLD